MAFTYCLVTAGGLLWPPEPGSSGRQAYPAAVPIVLAVAAFGALGALARYGVDGVSRQRLGAGFPWGTFTVNVVGSLLIGLVFAVLLGRADVPDWLKLGITTGFLGGFTTFSAFSLQTHRLLAEGAYGLAMAYVVATLAAGLAAVGLGVLIGRAV